MSDKVSSVDEMFERIQTAFAPSKADGVNAVFQFDMTGDKGGKYWIKVENNSAEFHEGEHDNPTTTLIATADDYMAIVNGDLNAMMAVTMQKLKVKGDMGMALKFQQMFPM